MAAVARLDGPWVTVRQYLLPDYPYEPALLRAVAADLATFPRLVTYNGRAFDMPMLAARLTVHGLFREQATLPDAHDDLLPDARRLFRRPLGGARLADVESGVLGVRRASDCPGCEVPARYFGYLRGGSPDILAEVLDHNFQDVVSLALLEAELCRLRAGGWRDARAPRPAGHGARAAARRRRRRCARARRGAPRVPLPMPPRRTRCAGSRPGCCIALGQVERAEELWTIGTRRASIDAAAAWIEVARIRERHRGDLHGAMEADRRRVTRPRHRLCAWARRDDRRGRPHAAHR